MFKIKNKDPRTTPMARFDKCDNFERSYDTWKILFYGKNSRLKLNYTMNSLNSSQSFKKKLKKNFVYRFCRTAETYAILNEPIY